MAQRFYNLVLLPRVQDDIAEYKRLNFHLYMALKKALFKPGAWFKGMFTTQFTYERCAYRNISYILWQLIRILISFSNFAAEVTFKCLLVALGHSEGNFY